MTSKAPVGAISIVTLIRTDTTLDHSQKAEKVCTSMRAELVSLLEYVKERARHACPQHNERAAHAKKPGAPDTCFAFKNRERPIHVTDDKQASARSIGKLRKAGGTLRSSRAVPHPSTNRALRRLTSEFGRDPVHSTRYGRQRHLQQSTLPCLSHLEASMRRQSNAHTPAHRRAHTKTHAPKTNAYTHTRPFIAAALRALLLPMLRSYPR